MVIKNFNCQKRGNIPNGVEKVARNDSILIAEYKCNPFYKLKGKISFQMSSLEYLSFVLFVCSLLFVLFALFIFVCLFCFVILFCFVVLCFVVFCCVLFCCVLFCFVLFCFVLFCFVLLFVFCCVLLCVVYFVVLFVCFLFVCLFVLILLVAHALEKKPVISSLMYVCPCVRKYYFQRQRVWGFFVIQ